MTRTCVACGFRDSVVIDEDGDALCASCSSEVEEPEDDMPSIATLLSLPGGVSKAVRAMVERSDSGLTAAEVIARLGLEDRTRQHLVMKVLSRGAILGKFSVTGPNGRRVYRAVTIVDSPAEPLPPEIAALSALAKTPNRTAVFMRNGVPCNRGGDSLTPRSCDGCGKRYLAVVYKLNGGSDRYCNQGCSAKRRAAEARAAMPVAEACHAA